MQPSPTPRETDKTGIQDKTDIWDETDIWDVHMSLHTHIGMS